MAERILCILVEGGSVETNGGEWRGENSVCVVWWNRAEREQREIDRERERKREREMQLFISAS